MYIKKIKFFINESMDNQICLLLSKILLNYDLLSEIY